MKKQVLILIAVFLAAFATSLAGNTNHISRDLIEQNYLEGVQSDNEGLRVSSAYFLGEMKSDKAVIPLMRMLRNDESESARLMAALSLIKIGDARGVYMVKKTADLNDSDRVKKLAKFLYAAYTHSLIDQTAITTEYVAAKIK